MLAALRLCLMLASLGQPGPVEPLTVSAAVSLTEALEEIAAAFRSSGGGPVAFNFAGSNVLSRQIVAGAPVDVFVSADETQMEVIERAGLVMPGTRVPVVGNQLVVVVGNRAPAITSARELVAEDIRRIAIGDPAAVPAGVYAKEYLERVGLWARLSPKIVPTANVRAALTSVQNGSADAAIVYATDAKIAKGVRVAAITGAENPRIIYPAAVIRTTRRAAAATQFVQFLRSAIAARIFEHHGFVPLSRP
jgi:molybdate transport system substrate-binding protein